jgi:hypothetical protein
MNIYIENLNNLNIIVPDTPKYKFFMWIRIQNTLYHLNKFPS